MEPTREEILRWKERLEDREFQQRLLRFQAHVYQVFEDLRRQTGLELIRAIIARDEIKTLDSLVAKIAERRKGQDPTERPYNFHDVRDLIGIKILCPFKNDVDAVIKYMFERKHHFRVLELETSERVGESPPLA